MLLYCLILPAFPQSQLLPLGKKKTTQTHLFARVVNGEWRRDRVSATPSPAESFIWLRMTRLIIDGRTRRDP